MKTLIDLLRRKEPTSADLQAALAQLDPGGKAATVTALRERRRAMLLNGEDGRGLDQVEADITRAAREHDRTIALGEELRMRLAEAESREVLAALAAERNAAKRQAEAVASEFVHHYAERVAELFAMLARLEAAEEAVAVANGKLTAAGVAGHVDPVEPRLTIDPPLMWLRRFRFSATGDARTYGVAS